MANAFVEELRWRGMVHDIMPGTEAQLDKEMTTAYSIDWWCNRHDWRSFW